MKNLVKILNITETVICVVLVIVLSVVCAPYLFGMKTGVIKSGSMEPTIQTGSYIYIKPQSADTIKEGDVIAFYSGDMIVAHRAIEIRNAENCIVTKGDNNESKDIAPVPYENVIGKVVFHVPVIGYFVSWLKVHSYILLGIVAGLMLIITLARPSINDLEDTDRSRRASL